jgi:hypothetical protein
LMTSSEPEKKLALENNGAAIKPPARREVFLTKSLLPGLLVFILLIIDGLMNYLEANFS